MVIQSTARRWAAALTLMIALTVIVVAGMAPVTSVFSYAPAGSPYPLFYNDGGGNMFARVDPTNSFNVQYLSGGTWYYSGYLPSQLIAAGIDPNGLPAPVAKATAAYLTAVANTSRQAGELERQQQTAGGMFGSLGFGWFNNNTGDSLQCASTGVPDKLALGDVLAAKEDWQADFKVGADYRHTNYSFAQNAIVDSYSGEVGATFVHDRWQLGLSIPFAQNSAQSGAAMLADERTGLALRPAYRLLDEKADGLTLLAISEFAYTYHHYDHAKALGLRVDTSHLTTALGLLAGHSTPVGELALGYVYYPYWNLDGDKEVNGKSRLDLHAFGLFWTVPFSAKFSTTLGGVYSYAPGVLAGIDRQDLDLSLRAAYKLNERWTLAAHGDHNYLNSSARTWGAGADLTYNW